MKKILAFKNTQRIYNYDFKLNPISNEIRQYSPLVPETKTNEIKSINQRVLIQEPRKLSRSQKIMMAKLSKRRKEWLERSHAIKRKFNTQILLNEFKNKIYLIKRIINLKLKSVLLNKNEFLTKLHKKTIYHKILNYNKNTKCILKITLKRLFNIKNKLIEKLIIFKKFKILNKISKLTKLKKLIKRKMLILEKVSFSRISILNIYLKWKFSKNLLTKLQKYILHTKFKIYINLIKKLKQCNKLFFKECTLKKNNLAKKYIKKTFNLNYINLKKNNLTLIHNLHLNLFAPNIKSRKPKIKWTHRELKYIREFRIPFLPRSIKKTLMRSRKRYIKFLFRTFRNFYYKDSMLNKYNKFNTLKPNILLNKQFSVNNLNFLTNSIEFVKKFKLLTENCLFNRIFGFKVLNLLYLNTNLLLNKKSRITPHFNIIDHIKQPVINYFSNYSKIYYSLKNVKHIKFINYSYNCKLKYNNLIPPQKKSTLKNSNKLYINELKYTFIKYNIKNTLINLSKQKHYSKILQSYFCTNKLLSYNNHTNIRSKRICNILPSQFSNYFVKTPISFKLYIKPNFRNCINTISFLKKLVKFKLKVLENATQEKFNRYLRLKKYLNSKKFENINKCIQCTNQLNLKFLTDFFDLKKLVKNLKNYNKRKKKAHLKFNKFLSNNLLNYFKSSLQKSNRVIHYTRIKFAYHWSGKYFSLTPTKFFGNYRDNIELLGDMVKQLFSNEFIHYIRWTQQKFKSKYYGYSYHYKIQKHLKLKTEVIIKRYLLRLYNERVRKQRASKIENFKNQLKELGRNMYLFNMKQFHYDYRKTLNENIVLYTSVLRNRQRKLDRDLKKEQKKC